MFGCRKKGGGSAKNFDMSLSIDEIFSSARLIGVRLIGVKLTGVRLTSTRLIGAG